MKWFCLQDIETPLNRWVGRCQTTHWSVVQFAHAGGIPGINALRWGWCVKTPKLEKTRFWNWRMCPPPGEEPCVWSDWGAKGCCRVRDQCGPQEGKACPGQKKIITKVNLIFIILDKYCWLRKYICFTVIDNDNSENKTRCDCGIPGVRVGWVRGKGSICLFLKETFTEFLLSITQFVTMKLPV